MENILNRAARFVAAAMVALVAAAGVTVVAEQPAAAAGIVCRVYPPSLRADRSMDLLMYVNAPSNYAGKPAAWTVKTRYWDGLTSSYYYRNYFISPTRHSYHTGPIAYGYKPYETVAGFWGTPCTKALGYVGK